MATSSGVPLRRSGMFLARSSYCSGVTKPSVAGVGTLTRWTLLGTTAQTVPNLNFTVMPVRKRGGGPNEWTGFTGGINWYRNLDRNWELTAHLAGAKVEAPALFVGGSSDPVLLMTPPAVMDGWVPDLRGTVLVDGAGHWVQQERPDEVNAALVRFVEAVRGEGS